MSHPQRPHGLQPTRLLCPWDFPGKSTGVGCHRLLRLIGCTPIQKRKFRKKSCLLPPFLLFLSLSPSSSFISLFIIKKPPNIKNIINVEKNHRPSVLYLPCPVNRPLTELGSPRGRRHFKDAHRCCRTGEKPGAKVRQRLTCSPSSLAC